MIPHPTAFSQFKKHIERFVAIDDTEFAQVLSAFTIKILKKHQNDYQRRR